MASNATTTRVSSSETPPATSSIASTPTSISTPVSTSTPRVTTTSTPVVPTSVTTASTPQSLVVTTSIVTQTNSQSVLPPETVIVTRSASQGSTSTSTSATSSSSSSAIPNSGKSSSNGGGLSSGATVAIAVVIPIVVIALLVLAGLFFWRRRKQRQVDAEQRKEEMEGYGYNPNNDPTLPTVAATDELTGSGNDAGGYRGWGAAAAAGTIGRKTSTQGNTTHVSDGYGSASPGMASDPSADPLMRPRAGTIEEGEALGALGVAGAGAGAAAGKGGVRRGPSNASSSYSAGDHSANSAEPPMPPIGSYQENYSDNAYYQGGPYENSYGGAQGQQPVIRDNPARRNTRIQEANVPMHQGASGIAQNF